MKNYKMIARPINTDKGVSWIAEYEGLKGLVGAGDTMAEAVEELGVNYPFYVEAMEEEGINIPKPIIENEVKASGKYALRMAKSTHSKLIKLANEDGVSLNTYINNVLSEKIGVANTLNNVKGYFDGMRREFTKSMATYSVNETSISTSMFFLDDNNPIGGSKYIAGGLFNYGNGQH